jgi:hypothetical protein
VPRPDVGLRLGGTTVDLRTRALAAGVVPAPRFAREGEVLAAVAAAREAGADLADVSLAPRLVGPAARRGSLPVAAVAGSPEAAEASVAAGAAVVLAPLSAVPAVAAAAAAGSWQAAVLVDDLAALPGAAELAAERRLVLALDTTRWSAVDALAGEPVALAGGCRIVRTGDVRRTRRVIEVVAALLEARRDG